MEAMALFLDGLPINSMVDLSMAMAQITRWSTRLSKGQWFLRLTPKSIRDGCDSCAKDAVDVQA